MSEKKPILGNSWFIVLMLILFFPAGLFLMWKYSKWDKVVKILVTVLVVLMTIFVSVPDDSEDTGNTESDSSYASSDTSNAPAETAASTVSKSVRILMDEGLSEDEAEAIMSDLNSVDIKELVSLKKGSGEGVDKLQAYAFSSDEASGTLTIENRKTYYIGAEGFDLFNADKGGKLDDLTRYLLSTSEKYKFISDAEYYVKQGLKAPSTAEFPSPVFSGAWSVRRMDDIVTVLAYVDAQNSYGAMVRSSFTVKISYSTSDCLYLEIDGQVLYQ